MLAKTIPKRNGYTTMSAVSHAQTLVRSRRNKKVADGLRLDNLNLVTIDMQVIYP